MVEESQHREFKTTSAFYPMGKSAEKAVCMSVFLTIWHYILSAELTKRTPSDCFLAILPTGNTLRRLHKLTNSSRLITLGAGLASGTTPVSGM